MKLDIGSLMFNMNIANDGGTPSWGTEMGQGTDYKFNFQNMDSFFEGMVYNSVSDIKTITNISCPLGKGGAQEDNYEYVMASLFKKVFANNTFIEGAKFLLLIVKRARNTSGFHIGRRTLKYGPKMTYQGKEINNDCFNKIESALGMANDSAWFINSIEIENQDEIHLEVIKAGDTPITFDNVEKRKEFVLNLLDKARNINYASLSSKDRKNEFKNWLIRTGHISLASHYPGYLENIIARWAGKNVYEMTDPQEIQDLYTKIKTDPVFKIKDDKTDNSYSSAVKNYSDFIISLSNREPVTPMVNKDLVVKKGSRNLVIYGTPGCGKSYFVENKLLTSLSITKDNTIRTTFFPDYTNVDFVGQILPMVDGDNVIYCFNPGPFTLALERALKTENPVALVIEELNRGNAASIFGDIFQLLDRDETNSSRYGISNVNIQNYLNEAFEEEGRTFGEIKIPSNLYLIATMNTSDQNVYKLDNAFKRRWDFQKMRNAFTLDHSYKDFFVPGMDTQRITWEDLVEASNEFILAHNDALQSEDKQIGVYFVDKDSLIEDPNKVDPVDKEKKVGKFESKVLEYLWDDVAKYDHEVWFNDAKSLDDLLEKYPVKGEEVFSKDFRVILDKIVADKSEIPANTKDPVVNGSGN